MISRFVVEVDSDTAVSKEQFVEVYRKGVMATFTDYKFSTVKDIVTLPASITVRDVETLAEMRDIEHMGPLEKFVDECVYVQPCSGREGDDLLFVQSVFKKGRELGYTDAEIQRVVDRNHLLDSPDDGLCCDI